MLNVKEKELTTFDVGAGERKHWRLSVDGRIATLAMDVNEEKSLKPGYKLKLNSYDLGVDIELYDALQRIRFEHPEVACVVITSAQGTNFLRRRKYLHARHFLSRLESKFLQVHK